MKKGKESNRPGVTTKWTINTPLTIHVQPTDRIEHAKVDFRGHTIFRTNDVGKEATVILGTRTGTDILVTPDDSVFTCIFGVRGHLSSLPAGFSGQEVTIIVH